MAANQYHVNPETGAVGMCKAVLACPFGGPSGHEYHYATKEEAQRFYEVSQDMKAALTGQAREPRIDPLAPGNMARVKDNLDLKIKLFRKQEAELAGLKYVEDARPVWGSPCINPDCKTKFHTLVAPEKAEACFDAVKDRMTPAQQRAWQVEQKTYREDYVKLQKEETYKVLTEYQKLPRKYRRREHDEAWLVRVNRMDRPMTYKTELKRVQTATNEARTQMKIRGETVNSVPLTTRPNAPQRHGGRMGRISSVHETRPPVTLEALQTYTLADLRRLGEVERMASTKRVDKPVRRRFRKDMTESVEELVYTPNYKTYSDFVAHLPPKSMEIYSLYQSAQQSERHNQPEVMELLEARFKLAKQEERELFVVEATPLDEIESLLKEKGL